MKFFDYFLAIFAGFSLTLGWSIHLVSYIQTELYGPFSFSHDIVNIRKTTDLIFSFGVTVLAGYIAARLAPSRHMLVALTGSMLYFFLSAYWYTTYNLSLNQWVEATVMLIKIPVGAYLGAWLFQKYSPHSNALEK